METTKIDMKMPMQEVQDLQEERDFLLKELFKAQESLEKYYFKYKNLKNDLENIDQSLLSDCDRSELESLVYDKIQKNYQIEVELQLIQPALKNSFCNQFKEMISELSGVRLKFIMASFGLFKLYKKFRRNKLPRNLISKLKSIKNGFNAEDLKKIYCEIDGLNSYIVKAECYTQLARILKSMDLEHSLKCAQIAYYYDPKAYRLKWLAFREYEYGNTLRANSILHYIEKNVEFSESESTQSSRIIHESNILIRKKVSDYLKKERSESVMNNSISDLQNKIVTLEFEKTQLQKQLDSIPKIRRKK